MKTITEAKLKLSANKKLSDLLFILWAGGAALLSYSLVYALRKPFTAATFDGLEAFGLDYKVLVTIIQILGYLIAKFIGIKFDIRIEKGESFEVYSCLYCCGRTVAGCIWITSCSL